MKQTLTITKKELEGYFSSAMALIFVGAFLAAVLFTFFWVDTFFARGIADVRPMFRWMPSLILFLVAALTMRQWSEEQRSGTLEVLMTLPIPRWKLVLGKYLAVMGLVAVALAMTLFVPITVAFLGNLDWGPVVGGYLATLLLASAYAAIGLWISSRTDNQIVALLLTVLVCGALYLVGSSGVTAFFGDSVAGLLRAIGSGSRFESVERGVVDLRDLAYYLSITGVFLTLNVLSLDKKRWSMGESTRAYRTRRTVTTVLLVANLLAMNVWLYPLTGLRADMTQYKEYSLSDTTKSLVSSLNEPMLIRGYFSERTHPLLAPLVPQIQDMLEEYRIASKGMIELDIVDPAEDPDKEAEANQTYGIQPTPFQVAGRYETSIINSYFDVLIRYGDQSQVLSFSDLIEIEARNDGSADVQLKNLEYDLTRAIKKAVYGFQSIDAVLASLEAPAELTLVVTPDTLPEWLSEAPATVAKVIDDMGNTDRLSFATVNPDSGDPAFSRQALYDNYGLQPLRSSIFDPQTYYFYMLLTIGDEAQLIYPSGDVSEASVRTSIESALKRSAPGFLKVVGLYTPPAADAQMAQMGQAQPLAEYSELAATLQEEYEVRAMDLATGQVDADVDVLVVVAPRDLSDKARFAVDQYLMRGGAVIVCASDYALTFDQYGGGLAMMPLQGTLTEMLKSYGVTVGSGLVMDPQNEAFPVQVQRQVGQMTIQEIQAVNYPFFSDIRPDGMAEDHAIVSNLPAVTVNWASPITIDDAANAEREVTVLLKSSPDAWVQSSANIQPDYDMYPDQGFALGADIAEQTLGVAISGVFTSAFADADNPFETPAEGEAPPEFIPATIATSPESARLVVVSSGEFLDDVVFQISSSLTADRYLNSLKLVQNAVAWATEDLDLLQIRARGTESRVLAPLDAQEESFWEGLNYFAAAAMLIVVGVISNGRRKAQAPIELLTREELADWSDDEDDEDEPDDADGADAQGEEA